MNLLDMRTVILSYMISNFICMVVIATLFRQNRRRYAGLGFWLADFVLQFIGILLIALRDSLPDFFWTISNAMIIGGTILLYTGLERFTENHGRQTHNYILLAVFIFVHAYFIYIFPSLAVRNILISLGLLAVCAQCAWLMLRRVDQAIPLITRGVGYVFLGFCLVSIVRVGIILVAPPGNDFFRDNVFDTFMLVTYQMLFIILTFNLFLMVNRRLVVELESDIIVRNKAENSLRESEERYQAFLSQSFEAIYRTEFDHPIDISLPVEAQIDAIYANAYMAESNQALANMYNLPSVEALIGTRLLDAHGGSDSPVNRAAFKKLIEGGYKSVNDETMEFDAHGNPIWFLSNTIGIVENGYLLRLWGTSIDITDRKRTEEALRENEALLRTMAENYPNSYISIINKDLTVGFTAGQEFKKLNLDPNQFVGMSLEQVFGEHASLVRENYLKTFDGAETQFELSINNQHQLYRTVPLIDQSGSVNRILVVVENITERKQAEEAVERGRKLLSSILGILPVGVCLTDESGHYRMMNDAYCAIYEYKQEEMLDQHYSVIMPPDQVALANAHYARLLSGDVGIPVERKRQRKDGNIIYIEAANALMENEEGQKMVITTARDITERKRTEEIMRIRLQLLEYATLHSLEELMQKALDEICDLTNSPIGFYHFVDEDQNTLSLQAWSTRTLAEFCKAEGRSLHYPISEAGVWVDCIHERKPVIHNDYASLPHRKGLPAGHAEVIRELVVPIQSKGRLVSILGVGNKPTNYYEEDIELVSYIADIIWRIVERKHADEQIRQLNSRLEQLAMTDELTGLENRRSFFKWGVEEIRRSQRYHSPLTLLMIDIDSFKTINDTFGHDAGDHMLCCVADTLQHLIRDIDKLARLGGEEFGILLPNTEMAEAVKLADRLRLAVERATCSVQDQKMNVTLSIGVATYDERIQDIDSLLKDADAAMYQAKNQGRNRVVYLG